MIAIGYLLGVLVTGLVAAIAVAFSNRHLAAAERRCEAAQEERAVFALHLLRAWAEADQLLWSLGQVPVTRPTLADLSRTARCQEDPCSSSHPQLRNLIISGRKTQTRQRVQPGKAGAPRRACPYRVGGIYGLERPMRLDEADELQRAIIEGRHKGRPPKKEIGRITITAVDRGPLGAITYDDARREGFDTTTAFKAHWVRSHDDRWIQRREVTTDPETGTVDVNRHLTDEDLAARFDERWTPVEVWIISFRIVSTPVYLAARPNRLGGDYVTTERDDYGRQIAMTSDVDATAAATIVDPHAAGRVHHVPEEAVHPAVVDAWQHDRGSPPRPATPRGVEPVPRRGADGAWTYRLPHALEGPRHSAAARSPSSTPSTRSSTSARTCVSPARAARSRSSCAAIARSPSSSSANGGRDTLSGGSRATRARPTAASTATTCTRTSARPAAPPQRAARARPARVLLDAGVGAPTVRRALVVLQGICTHAIEAGELDTNPVRDVIKPPVTRQLAINAPGPAQIEALRAQLDPPAPRSSR
jgi:hypothetical protein